VSSGRTTTKKRRGAGSDPGGFAESADSRRELRGKSFWRNPREAGTFILSRGFGPDGWSADTWGKKTAAAKENKERTALNQSAEDHPFGQLNTAASSEQVMSHFYFPMPYPCMASVAVDISLRDVVVVYKFDIIVPAAPVNVTEETPV
jgi:hypothetical protein